MRYIRLKSDPLKILASGYVGQGGLGEFDPDVYEEVEGELPEGYEKLNPVEPSKMAADAFLSLSPTEMMKPENLLPFVAGFIANAANRPDLIPGIIQAAQVSPAAEDIKDQISDIYPKVVDQDKKL